MMDTAFHPLHMAKHYTFATKFSVETIFFKLSNVFLSGKPLPHGVFWNNTRTTN